MSASFEGVHFPGPNLDGTRRSGGMKGVIPPRSSVFDGSISRLWSYTTVVNPKSARHAVAGLAFEIRILA